MSDTIQKYKTVQSTYEFMGIQVFKMKSPNGPFDKGYLAIFKNQWVYGKTKEEIETNIMALIKNSQVS